MGKISAFIAKLKNVKHIEIMACGVVAALVLTVYFSLSSCTSAQVGGNDVSVSTASTDYCSTMQAQVERIVSEISGVGSASVVINWDKSVTASLYGGNVTENPKPVGALIVCDGGNNTKVKLDVIYAVSTLLDLSIEKIMVYPKSH